MRDFLRNDEVVVLCSVADDEMVGGSLVRKLALEVRKLRAAQSASAERAREAALHANNPTLVGGARGNASDETEKKVKALEFAAREFTKHSGPASDVDERATFSRDLCTAALRYARAYYAEAREYGLIPEYERVAVKDEV